MRKLLSCTMLAVFALTLGVLAGACDGGGGGDDCLSHAECITAHGANWFCNPLTFTCECNSAAACVGKCGGSDNCGGTCANTCVAPLTCNATSFVCENTTCVPTCGTRECGPDPTCGQSCGTCGADEWCDMDGACQTGACVPDCGSRECGMDPPCGTLSCGTCTAPETCNAATGMCEGVCTPNCGARECGVDPQGCGTSCGTCTGTDTCNVATGMCEPEVCIPNCTGRECGLDPVCGTQNCGTCTAPEWCDLDGACQDGPCVEDCGNRECGMDPPCGTLSCGTCTGTDVCNAVGMCEPVCQPSCTGRVCGLDPVCGTQNCGTCTGTDVCNAAGQCEPQGTGQQVGEPCDFGTVNVGAGACITGLTCLGMEPNATSMPCSADGDCAQFMDALWNADCIAGGCGASFCVDECVGGVCGAGFAAQTIEGTCFCIPSSTVVGDQQAGEPCDFAINEGDPIVNEGSGNCATGLQCLGVGADPTGSPCAAVGDCTGLDALWNPDCVSGGCGASFCSAECVAGACDTGFAPQTIEGVCLCIPSSQQPGDQQVGEPCDFALAEGDPIVNEGSGDCAAGLTCLGMSADPDGAPCAAVGECTGLDPLWNPDCVGGGCGASFCSDECVAGACGAGYVPQTVNGTCFCLPSSTGPGDGQVGDICDQQNPCAEGLDCIGTQTSLSFCTEQCDCEAGTGCTVANWECMWSDGAATPTCWCGLPCPSQTNADCPNTTQWNCEDIGEEGSPFWACFPIDG
ncbi:MAG TPA: hypothetical protein PK668_04505 [Myxococcota bacterium]|nr:hypothetical protein [Myxococcota bacterium]HRY92121.1 hypothetical protein [Myxococcota bacterium]HSA22602.1 hypothetical protein [Myxococcota bacterium]